VWGRVLSGGAKWGYGLVSVLLLEILSGGAEHPLDPVWRRPWGRDLRTFWYRTVKIDQGDSTGWAKKFEKNFEFFTISIVYVHISHK